MSLRDEFEALSLDKETVLVPRLNKSVTVVELDAEQLLDYFRAIKVVFPAEADQENGRRWLLVARATLDESGARIWSDEDSKTFGKKNGWLFTSLFGTAGRLNGLIKEDSAKNSETSPSGTSSSGSPSN